MTDTFAVDAKALGEEDIPPSSLSGDKDAAPIQCAEPGCLNAVVKPARGRTPKYCPEHQGAKTGGKAASRATTFKGAAEVEKSLVRYLALLGMGVALVDEYDGTCIAEGADAVAHELVVLAATDLKLRKFLTTAAAPGKYGPLILATFGIVGPIAIHHNLIPQLSLFSKKDGTAGGE